LHVTVPFCTSSALQGASLCPTQASPGHRPWFPIQTVRALKGRNICAPSVVPPFQGFSAPPYEPKALPWAGLGWAFGPQAHAVRTSSALRRRLCRTPTTSVSTSSAWAIFIDCGSPIQYRKLICDWRPSNIRPAHSAICDWRRKPGRILTS